MLELIANIFKAFGAAVFVPIVIIVVAIAAGVKAKDAISAGLAAGVGLTGFNLVMNSFTPIISPLVTQIVEKVGINLGILDTGWQSLSIVSYSSEMGLLYFGIAILLQLALFFAKVTDCFMVGDLWNNYSYMAWGSILYVITGNVALALGLMITQTLYTALFSEVLERRFSTYYRYPNCCLVSPHNLEALPWAIAGNWLLNKIGLSKVRLDPDSIRERFGVIGEPMFLGFFVGLILGVIGNIWRLGTLEAWGQIFTVAITVSAVMVIYPKIAGVFAGAFAPLTQGFSKKAKSSAKKRVWYLGVNPAVGVGETATLTTGLICIPLLLAVAFTLPGNQVLPMVDLITLPSMSIIFACTSNGNILKSTVLAICWYALGLLVCTFAAPYYTQVAQGVGITIPASALMICSYVILAKPILGLLFFGFLSQNPLAIAAIIVVYVVAFLLFKKHKNRVHGFIEEQALMGGEHAAAK